MIDSTATLPTDEPAAAAPTTTRAGDAWTLLRKPQTLLTIVWPVATYLLGLAIGTAL